MREDDQTGLYYMPARYYSPALGRFLQADPSGFGGGFNLYAYAGNDPVNQVDPTGLTPDGGAYTVTLTESVPTYFMRIFGVPSLTVSATVHIDPVPYHLVIMQNETEYKGSYSIFHYQLRNREDQKLTGTYGMEEHLWSDPAATQHMAVAVNSENVFEPQNQYGEYRDRVGYGSYAGGQRGGSFNVYQTFSVNYYGGTVNISTEFEHITSVVGSDIFNNVIDIKP